MHLFLATFSPSLKLRHHSLTQPSARGAQGAFGFWSVKEFRYEKKLRIRGWIFENVKIQAAKQQQSSNFGKMQKRSGYAPSA